MKVTINEKGVRRWLQGHAWVFRSDLKSLEAERAGPATVFSESGKILGEALYSPKSLIALRRMTQGREKITAGLIRERIEQADRHRQVRFKGEKAYRVVFGEADFLPSLIVDRFGD
ncbi:MAG TPA: hypothetical protein DF383_03480, partial [Deltaproteobacteria bacterium]|nr:hypothetical protein [Deltaproteobacteria bacterium]